MSDKNSEDLNAETSKVGADGQVDKEKRAADGSVQSPVEELKAQLEKAKNDYLYLRAEFDTYKRNAIKERSDLVKYGGERVLVEVLNVFDNFERALSTKVTSENVSTFIKGVEMTSVELKNLLQKFGVAEIPSLGESFNPAHHEALSSEETSDYKEGQVSRVFRKPYKLHDKVIRTGQVVVAKPMTSN